MHERHDKLLQITSFTSIHDCIFNSVDSLKSVKNMQVPLTDDTRYVAPPLRKVCMSIAAWSGQSHGAGRHV